MSSTDTTTTNVANLSEVRAVCTTFADTADKDTTTARKARLVFDAMRVATLPLIAEAVAERFARRGIVAGVPSKATLSNYAKAWEYVGVTLGIRDDAEAVARMFTTISASAVPAAELKATVATIAEMAEGARSDALNAIPTAKAKRPATTTRKGEGDDATTDPAGSEAVTVKAVSQGLGLMAQRIREGHLTAADVKALTSAWGKVAAAIAEQTSESVESVETAAAALA